MIWVSEAKMGLIRNWSKSQLLTEDERTAYETVLALLDPESYPTSDREEMDAESERHSRGGATPGDDSRPPRGAVTFEYQRLSPLPPEFETWPRKRRIDWLMSEDHMPYQRADEAELDLRILQYRRDGR